MEHLSGERAFSFESKAVAASCCGHRAVLTRLNTGGGSPSTTNMTLNIGKLLQTIRQVNTKKKNILNTSNYMQYFVGAPSLPLLQLLFV